MLALVICVGNVFDDQGEVAGSCYCKFPLQSLVKIDKRQFALPMDGAYFWGIELLKLNFQNIII